MPVLFIMEGTEEKMTDKSTGKSTGRATAASASAGGRHGSKAKSTAGRTGTAARGNTPSGLNENTGEFRVGEDIIFGMRNGNVLIRRSPQGEEVEVGEATLAGLMVDAFFTDKFGTGKEAEYPTVVSPR
jgi:hypothetical protein